MMHGHEKSDSVIVAVKPANKVGQPAADRTAAEPTAAELVERRAGTKGNADWQSTRRTQSRVSVSQALERIRQVNAVMTRGGSRMRESRSYGSVRGAPGNRRSYRDGPGEFGGFFSAVRSPHPQSNHAAHLALAPTGSDASAQCRTA